MVSDNKSYCDGVMVVEVKQTVWQDVYTTVRTRACGAIVGTTTANPLSVQLVWNSGRYPRVTSLQIFGMFLVQLNWFLKTLAANPLMQTSDIVNYVFSGCIGEISICQDLWQFHKKKDACKG